MKYHTWAIQFAVMVLLGLGGNNARNIMSKNVMFRRVYTMVQHWKMYISVMLW